MHPVVRTVLQRLGLGLLTLFIVSIVIFSSLEMLPGGFAEAILGQGATPETVAAFNARSASTAPPIVRYVEWIGGVLHGDFGNSYAGLGGTIKRSVTEMIAPRLYNTFFLAIMTAIIAVPLSLFLGVLAALYRNSLYRPHRQFGHAHDHRRARILHRLYPDVLLRGQAALVLSHSRR